MKPVYQTKTAVPAEERRRHGGDHVGNCMQAAVASIFELDLDEVPHFAAIAGDGWWTAFVEWSEARGLGVMFSETDDSSKWPVLPEGALVLLGGKSPRGGWHHMAVGKVENDRYVVAHDPNPVGGGFEGEPDFLAFFVTLDPAKVGGAA